VGAPVEQVVDLHQVEPAPAQPRERALHLRDPGLAPARPHLGRDEEAVDERELGGEVARHRLGGAVHG